MLIKPWEIQEYDRLFYNPRDERFHFRIPHPASAELLGPQGI